MGLESVCHYVNKWRQYLLWQALSRSFDEAQVTWFPATLHATPNIITMGTVTAKLSKTSSMTSSAKHRNNIECATL